MSRSMVVWYPDWPVVASGVVGPVAVTHASRVVVASAEARSEGVRVGQRRRQAEAVCPGLAIVGRDEDRDARAFEPLVAAVAGFCPTVEVIRPGLCAFSARGPARYFGGEESLARQVAEAVDAATAAASGTRGEGCRVGVADGSFAGTLAARRGRIVPPGATAEFLAPLSVRELGRPELADLLERLGVRTLGQLAALPAPQVLSRFGWEGAAVHRLARGLDERPLDARRPHEDLSVEDELDPPVERVDTAAFVAKALADRLYAGLVKGGWRCTLVRIEAESEHGESLCRTWRHDGTFSAATLAERVRWQLDGWLTGPTRPTAGLTKLRLVPEEIVVDHGTQLGFWGGMAEADRQAARVLARVQSMIGPDGVLTAVLDGGRSPIERATLIPWGDQRASRRRPELPWPGRIPPPAPARTSAPAGSVALEDSGGRPVVVNGRAEPSGAPARLRPDRGPELTVSGWSAPWPCQERWWDPDGHRRRAWMQVAVEDGRAFLLAAEGGRWSVEAVYD
ncbi:MAG TPA: DNA polymerase Y family protein [Acidimicrobiales bacterium]|nr:DNA polymerase Y family protein [Acidimicrobiales bacterium]